jgi:hypothetical protein
VLLKRARYYSKLETKEMNKVILITLLAGIAGIAVFLATGKNHALPTANLFTNLIGEGQSTTPEPVSTTPKNQGGKCPPGQKYIEYGPGISPRSRCYTPATDAGKVCYSSADCQAQCMGDLSDPAIKNCALELGPNHCPSVTGKCGNGSEISGAFIDKKDYVILNLLD